MDLVENRIHPTPLLHFLYNKIMSLAYHFWNDDAKHICRDQNMDGWKHTSVYTFVYFILGCFIKDKSIPNIFLGEGEADNFSHVCITTMSECESLCIRNKP